MVAYGQRSDFSVTVRIGDIDVVNFPDEKLLKIQIISKLSFDKHVTNLCQKASNKLYALARISPNMDEWKLTALMRT